MLRSCRDELICDLAETYHIYDWRSLPARLTATYAAGLRADSRTIMKLNGQKYRSELFLLAAAVDRLSLLVWAQTADARKGLNKPEMLTSILTRKEENRTIGFRSGEEFERAWKTITEVSHG